MKDCESIPTIGILNRSRSENETNALKILRLKNPLRVIIGQVNINSLRNKIELLRDIARTKLMSNDFQNQT